MAAIELKNVFKRYPSGQLALDNINLRIAPHEFVVIIGPSGCGKSTLLKVISGLESISEGELWIDEEKANELEPSKRNLAMVFQNYALYPHMTVHQNIAFSLKIAKVKKADIKQRVLEVAKVLNIEDILSKKPGKLSGGQRQRVAIGRAIVRRPKLFLFDEPLSNLDAKLRTKMRIEIATLHKNLSSTFVYVTHDQVEAMSLGSRIVIMNKGKIIQVDTPLALYQNPKNKFVAGFIGSPPMNFFKGEIILEGEKSTFRNSQFQIALPHRIDVVNHTKVFLGIRPDHIFPATNEHTHQVLSGDVVGVEILGNEKLIYAQKGDDQFISKVPTKVACQINSEVQFSLDSSKVYLFDQETEERIQ